MKKIIKWILIGIAAFIVLGLIVGGKSDTPETKEVIQEPTQKIEIEQEKEVQPTPYSPKDWQPITPDWEPKYPYGIGIDRITYTVSSMNTMFRLEPNYANRTDSGIR